MITKYQYELKE